MSLLYAASRLWRPGPHRAGRWSESRRVTAEPSPETTRDDQPQDGQVASAAQIAAEGDRVFRQREVGPGHQLDSAAGDAQVQGAFPPNSSDPSTSSTPRVLTTMEKNPPRNEAGRSAKGTVSAEVSVPR